jgi:3-oxoacyl-(acyl-carrier-protein) synthase
MPACIASIGLISPFDRAAAPPAAPASAPAAAARVGGEQGVIHRCIEPDYKQLIHPIRLRRMSRILKLGLGAAQLCLNCAAACLPEEEPVQPDAIVVGTGLACVNELDSFLSSMIHGHEHGLSPIPFIHSSHNTVAAQISHLLQNHSYNATYCHRGVSFECALADALMLIEGGEASNVLLGGIDEFSIHYHTLMQQIGETGMSGEGAAFFLLRPALASGGAGPRVTGVRTFYRPDPSDAFDAQAFITDFLADSGCSLQDVDTVVLGFNGDPQGDAEYHHLVQTFVPASARLVAFKHLCGECMTASGFAFALSAEALREGGFPSASLIRQVDNSAPRKVLLFNHYRRQNYALILMEEMN